METVYTTEQGHKVIRRSKRNYEAMAISADIIEQGIGMDFLNRKIAGIKKDWDAGLTPTLEINSNNYGIFIVYKDTVK